MSVLYPLSDLASSSAQRPVIQSKRSGITSTSLYIVFLKGNLISYAARFAASRNQQHVAYKAQSLGGDDSHVPSG